MQTPVSNAEPTKRPAKALATRGGYLRGWFTSGAPRVTLMIGQARAFFTDAELQKAIDRLESRGLRAEPVPITVTIGPK